MRNENNRNRDSIGCGISLCSIVGVVFIVLKLCKVINWSWWLVLLPIYGQIVLAILSVIVIIIIAKIANKGEKE